MTNVEFGILCNRYYEKQVFMAVHCIELLCSFIPCSDKLTPRNDLKLFIFGTKVPVHSFLFGSVAAAKRKECNQEKKNVAFYYVFLSLKI